MSYFTIGISVFSMTENKYYVPESKFQFYKVPISTQAEY